MTESEFLSKPLTLAPTDPTTPTPTKKGLNEAEFLAIPGLSKALSSGRMGVRGTSASQYLEGLRADQNPLTVKAANQGAWSEAANSSLQFLSNALQSGVNTMITLPGINTLINKIGNSDQEFGNILSDYVNKVNKDFNQEVVPVYNNPETKDVSEWMFENLPSLGSTVGMLLPVLGELKLLGLGAKAMKGYNLVSKLVKASKGIETGSEAGLQFSNTIDAIVAGVHSRQAESMMEGQDAGNQAYQESIDKGFSEDVAKKAQLAASQETYNKNWPLLALDIMQFGIAFRSFKGLSREANALEATALKGTRLGKAAVVGGEIAPEGYEEYQQYITTQEAVRNAKIKYGIDKDDYSTFSERMKDYMAGPNSDQLWTSTIFGLVGGGIFAGISNKAGTSKEKEGSIMREQVKTALGQTFAVYEKDPVKFAKSSHDEIHAMIFNAVENRRADDVKNLFSLMKESKLEGNTDEEKQELKAKADFALTELDKYTKLYDEIAYKNTPEVTHHILAVNGAFTNWAQVQQERTIDFHNALKFTTELNKLDASYSKVIEAEAQLKVLDEFQKEPNLKIDKSIYETKRSLLQEEIKQHREAIKTNNPSDNIDEKINKVDKSRLTSFAAQKVLVELHLGQLGIEAHKATTQEGIEEIKKRNEEHRDKQIDTELNNLVDAVTPEKSSVEIQKLRDTANKLGKAKEFEAQYNKKLAIIKTNSPKFDPDNTAISLTGRWKDNTLLKEQEVNHISKIMLKSGGIPENSTIDENSISALANSNPVFAKNLIDYFKTANAIKTTVETVTKIPTSSATNDPNEEANKIKEQAKQEMSVSNAPIWVSQGTQFEWDRAKYDWIRDTNGNLIPRKSNLTDKIDWKYLNSASVPIGADLSYEYDYNDEWNKKNKNAELSLFEIVHYDSRGDRHVIGALTAYDSKRNYETQEDGNRLKTLREQLWKEAQSKPKLGIQKLDTSTRLKKYQSTNVWNVTTLDTQGNRVYNSPLDVLKPDEQLILGVARLQNNIPYLDFNGDPIGNRAVSSFSNTKGSSGMVYMMILNPATKEYYPIKLFTKSLKTNKELHEFVTNKMRELENDPTKNKEVKDDITDIIFMHDLNFVNGNYNLTVGDVKDPKIITINPNELEQKIGDLILQVDVTKINKDINGVPYNKQLAKNGFISTDLNPNEHFHSTNIQIEPYISGTTFVEGELKVTGQTLPIPSTIIVSESKFEKIQGVGTTNIDLVINATNLSIEDTKALNWYNTLIPFEQNSPTFKDDRRYRRLLQLVKEGKLTKISSYYDDIIGDKHSFIINQVNTNLKEEKLRPYVYIGDSFTPINIKETKQWFSKNLPQVPISIIDNIIETKKNGGTKAWGMYKDAAITLYKGAPRSTDRHEAFHAIFDLFLTAKEKENILNEARQKYPQAEANGRGIDGLEEVLAEDFEDYIESDGKNEQGLGYNVKQFFNKLWQFIKAIFSNDSANITLIDQLFERINTGYYKDRKLPAINSYKGTNFSIANTNPYRVNEAIETINYQFFKALDELKKEYLLGDQSDLQVLKRISPNAKDALGLVYQRVFNGLIESYNSGNKQLEDILNNFFVIENGKITGTGDYYGLAIQDLVKYGIVVREARVDTPNNSDDLSDTIPEDFVFNFNEDDFKEDIHQKGASFINPKDTLTYEVRKTLRQLEKYKFHPNAIDPETGKKGAFLQEGLENHLGFHTFVNYDEVQNYLQKNIANIFDVDDMMNKLDELKFLKPEIYGLLNKLNENNRLKTKFFSDFSKIYIPYIMIQQRSVESGFPDEDGNPEKETRINVFNANTKSINKLLIDDWNTNLITHRNEVTNQDGTIDKVKATLAFNNFNTVIEAYRNFKEVTPEIANRLSATVNKFGLTISPQVFTNEFNARVVWEDGKRVERTPYNNLLDLLSGKSSITTILSNVVQGTNPYQGDAIESSALRRVTGAVARTEQNLHQDNIINANGDTQYSYLSPTFLHKKVAELKTEQGRELYLSDSWFMGNKWLQDLANPENQELRDVFEISIFNSLKLENQASTEFSNLTTKELAITDINLYDNPNGKDYGFYRTPIITGSSMAPIIRFLKYDKATVIEAFYQLALVESGRIQNLANLDIKVKNLSTRGNQYHFVDIFNEKPDAIETENIAKLAIEEWLQAELIREKNRLETEGVITSVGNLGSTVDAARHNSTFKDYENKLEEYFYNRSLASAMIIQLFHVDPSYYKNNNDFQHRGGQILKTVKMIDTKASYNGTTVGENYNAIYLIDEKLGDSDITDSQTYISVDRRRKIGIGYGEWDENNEKGYDLVKKGKAYDDSFSYAFSPQKPFYFNHETLGADWILPVQIKNMEVTLVNNFTKGKPKLEFLREYMESNGIDSVIFTSAVKAGEYGAVSFDDLKSGTKPITHYLQNKYYGRQTEMPNHHIDVDILNASQQKKLITGDIPEDTKFFGDKVNKQEIYNAYQKLITTNIIDSYNQIEGEFKDINEIQRILLNEVQSRGLGNSFRKALEIKNGIQGDKVFNIPLFDPIFGYKMQAILNAIIRNNVTKQRINGGSLAYMSAFGIVKPTTKEELKVVRDKEGNILHYEVMLPAWMKEHLPRNAKGEVDFESIKKEAPGLLEMFGYFIPTEGKNSMMAANLVGFIPDLQSGVAAFPKELVAISGKDFDKDDVYIMIPNHEIVDGVLQKIGYGIGKEGIEDKTIDINLVKNVLPDEVLNKMVSVKSIDPKTGEESTIEMSVKDAINDIKEQYRKVEDYIECLG